MTPKLDAELNAKLAAGDLPGAIRVVAKAVRNLGDQPDMNNRILKILGFLETRATFTPPLPLLFHSFPSSLHVAGGADNPAVGPDCTASSLSEAVDRAARHFKVLDSPDLVAVRLDLSDASDPVFRAEPTA